MPSHGSRPIGSLLGRFRPSRVIGAPIKGVELNGQIDLPEKVRGAVFVAFIPALHRA